MKTVIELNQDSVMIKREENGLVSTKYTTPDLLKQALSVTDFHETPLFPGGDGVIKYMTKGNIELYFYVSPPKRIEVSYDDGSVDNSSYEIETPYILFTLRLVKESDNSRRLISSDVYGLKNPVRTINDPVYRLPFPNIFDNSNNRNPICWGRYSPIFTGSESIPSIFTQFFLAPFNSDLNPSLHYDEDEFDFGGYDDELNSATDLLKFMDYMIGNESHPGAFKFPNDLLELRRGTVEEVINNQRREIHNVY